MITKQEFQDYLKRMEVMLDKEKQHLKLLVRNKMPTEMIFSCDTHANHLIHRIKQYKEHIEKMK